MLPIQAVNPCCTGSFSQTQSKEMKENVNTCAGNLHLMEQGQHPCFCCWTMLFDPINPTKTSTEPPDFHSDDQTQEVQPRILVLLTVWWTQTPGVPAAWGGIQMVGQQCCIIAQMFPGLLLSDASI